MYFSSGVMLLNLRKCAEDRVMEKVEQFARDNPDKIIYSDQEPLNAVLWDKRIPLHPRWNTLSHWFTMALKPHTRSMMIPEIVEAIRDPAIMHFSGPNKPWHYSCTTPYRQEYLRYLAMTPWRCIEPESVGLKQVLIKHCKLALRRIISRQLGYRV
jgi:lipopolysaccharide biosynthesis glycosyltransferase